MIRRSSMFYHILTFVVELIIARNHSGGKLPSIYDDGNEALIVAQKKKNSRNLLHPSDGFWLDDRCKKPVFVIF